MALTFEFDKAYYDHSRRAVVCPAKEGDTSLTCLVTAEALNDRGDTSVEGDALLVVFAHYREEIERLISMMHTLGQYAAPGEIWLTTREFYR